MLDMVLSWVHISFVMDVFMKRPLMQKGIQFVAEQKYANSPGCP